MSRSELSAPNTVPLLRGAILLNSFVKKTKKTVFKKAKETLPEETVLSIQKRRLEGGLTKTFKPGSYKAKHSYSVVSAVYNVEKYLDDFFESLTTQTIKLDALKLIMVDDGSTDSSAEIIKSWQKRFPSLIEYLHKENGGQASARNIGIDFAETEWVTFIDPDDFASQTYFEEVDKTISAYKDIQFATCRIIFYNESKGQYFDKHPLREEFKNNVSLYNANDDFMPISLATNKSFFRVSNIKDFEIRFDTRVKPDFEDAHFLNKYLLNLQEGRIAYLRKPIYYYRKREDGTSTLDSSWSNPDKVSTVLRHGKLDLLEYAKERCGHVPFFIQKTVLYDLSWYFKNFKGKENRTQHFQDMGLEAPFWESLYRIFTHIETETIEEMPGGWLNYENKFGCINTLKGQYPKTEIAYIDRIDYKSKLILVRSLTQSLSLYCNGKKMHPIEKKTISRTLFGRNFYSLYASWYKLPSSSDTISYSDDCIGGNVSLSVRGKHFKHHVQMSQLNSIYKNGWDKYKQNDNIWIFMDRDTQADDSAEHLYRWIRENHPNQKCYFALRKEAKDWNRLETEGFSLLPFGSKQHEKALRECSMIVSSHADVYVHSYFDDNFYKSKRFVFLQHGVTKDDLSSWLNGKPIDLITTASKREYDSIAKDGTTYNLTPRQVILSGFPRHDALLAKKRERKTILIMPTWRDSLAGKKKGVGNARELNPDFKDSQFCHAWTSLLSSPTLKKIATSSKIDVVFWPHTNLFPYIESDDFEIPDYIEILGNQTGASIQQAFANADLLVTDYSSTAFETAYLGCQCIYYQFDSSEAFSGAHIYSKGYFDYRRDGFGPVTETEEELIAALQTCADRNFEPEEKYAKRMAEFFPFHDGKCCERVYNRIKELDDGKY